MVVETRDALVADHAVLGARGAREHARAAHLGRVQLPVVRHAREAVQAGRRDGAGVAEGGEGKDDDAAWVAEGWQSGCAGMPPGCTGLYAASTPTVAAWVHAGHHEVRGDLVLERQPRVGHQPARVHPVERKAAGHQPEVEELERWVRTPAAVVLGPPHAREAPLAEALAENLAHAAAHARGQKVVQLADHAATARAKADYVEQEAYDDDQGQHDQHRAACSDDRAWACGCEQRGGGQKAVIALLVGRSPTLRASSPGTRGLLKRRAMSRVFRLVSCVFT